MPSNCAFLLDNGRRCAAPALHNEHYCRHHTPAALARRRARLADPDALPPTNPSPHPDPDEDAPIPPAHLRAYWRVHHRIIATSTDDEQCQEIFAMILDALSEHAISPRSAGRLLQAVYDRRKVLAAQAQEAAFRLLEDRVRQHKAAVRRAAAAGAPPLDGNSPETRALLEAVTSNLFSAGAPHHPAIQPFGASENYPVSR